jgi:hypothetical protein
VKRLFLLLALTLTAAAASGALTFIGFKVELLW